MSTLLTGDRIEIVFTDDPQHPLQAVVCATLSDQQEGLSPEIEEYVACWVEIVIDGTHERRSISLGTDSRYTMEGREITLRPFHA